MAELKPCDYCHCEIPGMLKVDEELASLGDYEGLFQVHCYMCGAKGPVCTSREQAIDAWNKRS